MRFDNKQFEQGCKESMSTLDKLKAKINGTSADSLDGLGKAAKNIDLSNIEKAVDQVNKKFSVLGVVGATIIQDLTRSAINMAKNVITAVPNIIKEKGWSRAMNIEKAKFQLEGLHVAWEKISGDIDYAVSGTAYGLDAAANAASQLVASGVEVGDSMKAALRGISGVAAMTQSEYSEIAPIFTTIAGQGKVMTMQLRQIENRGLNAAATMADFFNGVSDGSIETSDTIKAAIQSVSGGLKVSEADIREFVTDGVINFDMFSAAMDNAFGQHAKDANKTFEGVMKNIKSALGRIGADFYTPIIKEEGPIVKFLQQVRSRIDDIRKTLQPAVKVWEQFLTIEGTRLTNFLKNLDVSFFSNLTQAGINIFNVFYVVGQTIRHALEDVASFSGGKGIASLTKSFADFTKTLIPTQKTANKLRATFRGIFSAINIVVTVISRLLSALFGLTPAAGSLGDVLLTITATIGNLITYFDIWINQNDIVTPLIKGVTIAVKLMVVALVLAVEKVIELIKWVKELPITQRIIAGISDALYLLIGAIAIIATKVKNLISVIKSGNLDKLGVLGDAIIFVKDGVLMLVDAISQLGFVQAIIETITGAFDKMREAADKLFGKDATTKISKEVVTINDAMVPLAGELKEVSLAADSTANSADNMAGGLHGVTTAIGNFVKSLPIGKIVMVTFAVAFAYSLYKMTSAMQLFAKGVNSAGSFLTTLSRRGFVGLIFGTGQYARTPNRILDIAIAIGVLAASINALTKIDTNKLNEAVKVLGELALGYTGVLIVLSALEKWLGFAGAIDYIGVAMLEVGAGIAVLAGALALLTKLDLTNVDKTMQIMAEMAVGLTAMAVVLGKFGGSFAKMGASIISIGASMMILVKAFKALNDIKANDTLGDLAKKLGAVGVLALEMVGIAKLCDMLGGKSFMRLAISAAGLALAMQIFVSLLDKLPKDFTKKVVDKIKEIAEGLKEVVKGIAIALAALTSIVALVAGAIAIVAIIKKGTSVLVYSIGGMFESLSKIRKHQDDHKKALNTLATAVLVASVAGAVALLAGVVLILTKADLAKNKDAFDAGMTAMTTMLIAMSAMIFEVGIALKGVKGAGAAMLGTALTMATVFAATVGIAVWVYSVFAQNKSTLEKAKEIAVAVGALGVVLIALYTITHSMSQLKDIKFNKTTTAGLIAMVTAIGVIAGSVIALSYVMSRGQTQLLAVIGAFTLLGAAMFGMYELVKALAKIEQTNFKPSTFKVILGMVVAIGTIAVSLTLLTSSMDTPSDIGKLAASTVAMAGVMLVLAGCLKIMSTIKYNKQQMEATKGMILMLVAIAGSLSLLMYMMDDMGDIAKLLASAIALAGVFAAFAAMTRVLLNGKFSAKIFQEFLAMLIPLTGITVALIALSRFGGEWQDILASALAMSAVFATFAAMTFVLSKATFTPDIWNAFAGIAVEAIAIAFSLSLLKNAMSDASGMLAAAVAMSVVFATFAAMTLVLSKTTFTPDIWIAMLGIAGEAIVIAYSLSLLTGFEWQSIMAAAVGMSIVMGVFGGIAVLLSKSGSALTGMVAMIGISAAALLVGFALSQLSSFEWSNILVAALGMSIVIGVFGGMAILLGNIPTAMAGMVAMIGLAAAALIVGISLTMVAQYDWQNILVSALGITLVMAAFAVIAGVAGAIPTVYAGMVAMIGIAAAAVLIGLSLSMVAQNDWQSILAAAGAMVGVMVIFSVIATILGALIPIASPGAAALAAIGAAAVIFATALLITSTALTVFAVALNLMLPTVALFIQTVVPYKDQLLGTAAGITVLAGSLVILGIAGSGLILGAPGLILAAAGLIALVPACKSAQGIDISSLAESLAKLVVPGLAMALVGPALMVAAAGMAVCTVAMLGFAAALVALSAAFQPAMKALDGIGKKVESAKKWGSDLVNNFVNGIKNKIGTLKNAISGVADLIASYIHFTTPDIGSLSDADTFMPDMMDLLSSGIKDGFPDIENAMSGLTNLIDSDLDSMIPTFSESGKQGANGYAKGFMDQIGSFDFNIKPVLTINGKSSSDFMADSSLPTDVKRQMQEAAIKEASVSFDTSGFDEIIGSSGSGGSKGSGASGAASAVRDLADAFKATEKSSKVSLTSMANNLRNNLKEHVQWADDVNRVTTMGYDKAIIDWVKQMGVGGHETVKALKKGTKEEIADLNNLILQWGSIDDITSQMLKEGYSEAGTQYAHAMIDAFGQTFNQEWADTIQNSISPFEEFDKKTELSGTKLLSNMQSQLDGVREWGNNMQILMDRGINEGILEHLAELGPASYEQVNAMVNMTEPEFERMNQIWDEQTTIGEEIAKQFAAKMAETGYYVTEGFVDGIDGDAVHSKLKETFETNGAKYIEKTVWETASPSKRTHRLGLNIMKGIENGLNERKHIPPNILTIMSKDCIDNIKKFINYGKGKEIATNLIDGLERGINAGKSRVINAAVGVAVAAYEAACAALDIHSPSKAFRQIGIFIDEGWAQGINYGSDLVVTSVEDLADATVEQMKSVSEQIAENLQNEFDGMAPVITPVMDLSELQNGKNYVNSLLSDDTAARISRSISSDFTQRGLDNATSVNQTSGNTQNFIFNQTNNSPKALDSYEIYRQSRNLMSQIEGALS